LPVLSLQDKFPKAKIEIFIIILEDGGSGNFIFFVLQELTTA